MVPLPTFSTPATDALCKEIAKKSHGVCFLGFSRGKDSLAAWQQCRKYFDRVIPFHAAWIPGLRFAEEALRYYEDEFDTHILRMMEASLSSDLLQGIYQLREDAPYIGSLGWHRFDKLELLEFLRAKFNLPRAWCAFGINACDSQDRRIQCVQFKGRHETNRSFYPTWDWPHKEIVRSGEEAGLKLSSEYRYTSRTIEGTPSATHTLILKEHYPEDFKLLKAFYPLCEAKVFRERLNERVLDEMKADRIRNGGKKADAGEGDGAAAGLESGEGASKIDVGASKSDTAGEAGSIKPSKPKKRRRKGAAAGKGSAAGEDFEPSRRDLERRADERLANGPFKAWEEAAKSDPQFYTKLWAKMKDCPPKACKSEDGFDFFEGEEMDRLLDYRFVKEMAAEEAKRNGLQLEEAESGEVIEGAGEGLEGIGEGEGGIERQGELGL